ncbi:putative Ig domain-containing protein, partial [Scytonema sp. NUACC21]
MNFNVQTYPGLQQLLQENPDLLETVSDEDIAFKFNIVATATAMTRGEFVAEQSREALKLRQAILQDKTATPALINLAANPDTWTNAFLAALEQTGLLREESGIPPIRESQQIISLIATLSTGLLVGPAGKEIKSTGNLVNFFENVRKWYGHDASKIGSPDIPNLTQFDKGLSRQTHSQAFSIYVPFGEARVELPQGVPVPSPNFGSAFITPSTTSNLVSLTGPIGYGNDNIIPVGTTLPYTIRFENAATAPTAVSSVQLVTKLDDDLDERSFQLGGIKLGDIQVNIPGGRSSFQGDFDFIATKGFILRVSAGIDLPTKTASWLLEAIDPETGNVIKNPNVGILLPNDANARGAGFASYTIAPLNNGATGTEITSTAKVIFNTSAPIDTNLTVSKIDGAAPTATITATPLGSNNSATNNLPLVAVSGSTDYRVKWNATDDSNGSGVKHVTVYVAENGGDFIVWKSQTIDTEAIFNGKATSKYEFLVLATDNAGNKQTPPLGITAPSDGFSVNLGTIPTVGQTTQQILPPQPPTQQISTNQLFIQALAENNTPATLPTTNKPEFESVLRPFTASAFATNIPISHANIGAMAIAVLPDGTVLASGGANRGSLYRFPSLTPSLPPSDTPIATLPQPIFDMAVDRNGVLWATTGGGPLLQLNSQTGNIVKSYGESITQALAIHPTTGSIYVSSGNGIEIFNPVTETFTHYSDLRVDSLAFAPDGSLWGTSWPDRGLVVKFNNNGSAQRMLSLSEPVDSLAFGVTGSQLEGLAFVSTNKGDVLMVDLATMQHVKVATGKNGVTWGENIETTRDGRVLISHSSQIDVLNPIVAPKVAATNPVKDAIVALPLNTINVTFDSDMFTGANNDLASVLNPNNYQLIGALSNIINPVSVQYDAARKSALLGFNNFDAGNYEFKVLRNIKSTAGAELETEYKERFTTVSNFSNLVNFNFSNARSERATNTISFDVTITSLADQDLLLPVMLLLDPSTAFTGVPQDAVGRTSSGAYLLDLKDNLIDGRLKPGQSTTVRTITVNNPDALRVEFTPNIYAMPYPNMAPVITSNAVLNATVGIEYQYQVAASDPDGSVLGYLLYDAPEGMTVDNNGLISWNPVAGGATQENVVLYTYDLRGGYTTQSFSINVLGANHKPVFSLPSVSGGTVQQGGNSSTSPTLPVLIRGAEGRTLQIKVAATDSDKDKLTYWADNLPGGSVFDPTTGILTWTPNYEQAGTYENVQFVVSDGKERVTQTVNILVAPTNQTPTLVRPANKIVREGDYVRIQLKASDADGTALTYFSNLLPGGATLDPVTGVFEWTPAYFQAGEFEIPFSVSDGESVTSQTTKITVLNVNAAPVFEGLTSWVAQEGETIRFRAFAFDPDNPGFVPTDRNAKGELTLLEGSDPSVTYSVSGLPSLAAFDVDTAMFTWTPGYTSAGTYNVTFRATDDGNGTGVNQTTSITVPITIRNTNRAPLFDSVAIAASGSSTTKTITTFNQDGTRVIDTTA